MVSRFVKVLTICFILFPLLYTLQTSLTKPTFDLLASISGNNNTDNNLDARLLNGLLSPAFKERSCLSRYQSHLLYNKERSYEPSSYLMSKLRHYESLHSRCGPFSGSYSNETDDDCKYLIWIPANGLGNRMVSLASTFVYALITDRVLLVDFQTDMDDLFCEPFPNSTWLLPNDFPKRNQWNNINQVKTFLSFITDDNSSEMESPPSFLYIDLHHSIYGDQNLQMFHCDHTQEILNKVRVLFLQTDQYLVPSLFLMSHFKAELMEMFPDNGVVFYHLGRYLFHPSNEVWGIITDFYKTYLTKADEIIGFQIRVFHPRITPHQTVIDQVMACAVQNNILPELDREKLATPLAENRTSRSKVVLVASLYPQYADELRLKYCTKRQTIASDVTGVYQPSHEEFQKSDDNQHNMKALAEIYLLSLSDVLVTSSVSTFGYVAQGLAGLKPWVLTKQNGFKRPNPPCRRDVSIEPCFQNAPVVDCKNNKLNVTTLFPHMDHCVDKKWGLKMAMDRLSW